jgi:hypothetical protein
LISVVKSGGKPALKNILRQAGIEASEEGVSYLANYIADKAAKDPSASFSLNELAQNMGSGAISGSVLGGGAAVLGNITAPTARNIDSSGKAIPLNREAPRTITPENSIFLISRAPRLLVL